MSAPNWLEAAVFIDVDAGVRYWEDAELNGVEDVTGLIPLKVGERWRPTIELATGRVIDWPNGSEAHVHYKVCDDGEYWLLDRERHRIAKWRGDYVPNRFLCVGDSGYGDYIIMTIEADGLINGWDPPRLDPDDWKAVSP